MHDIYQKIAEMARDGTPGVVATVIRTEGSTPREVGAKMVISGDGRTWGTIGGGSVEAAVIDESPGILREGTPRILEYELEEGGRAFSSLCGGRMEVLVEPLTVPERLYLFGAGHVAQPVAEIAKRAGFAVTVIDPRPEQANEERHPLADDILVKDFAEAAEQIPPGENSYLVIVTPNHEHDEAVVQATLNKPHRYIGMIASRKKVAAVIAHLKKAGFSQEAIGKLHSPIGLDIGAETPEEIAVSIVAELIATRRGVETTASLTRVKRKAKG